MLVLGLDFETTGLDPAKDRIIEVGAILWDVERKTPLLVKDFLIKAQVPEEIENLTGILQRDLDICGISLERAMDELKELMLLCDYVVAHNGNEFDKRFYEAELGRLGLSEAGKTWDRPWIDTRLDIAYPAEMGLRSGEYLEEKHNIVNPFPHRAVFDVLAMLQLLSMYNIQEVIGHATSPTLLVKANVSYDDRIKAKERGYRWDAPSKCWVKNLKESQLKSEVANVGFEVILLKKLP